MSRARCIDACDFLPTCTAREGWPLLVFALSVIRHGRHADSAWALGLNTSGGASRPGYVARYQGALRASPSIPPRLM